MSQVKNERIVVITRVFNAPRSRVFAAWTEAEHLARWFGPKRFTVPSCETDPRPGGAFRVCMRSPEGRDFWVRGVFRQFVAPERGSVFLQSLTLGFTQIAVSFSINLLIVLFGAALAAWFAQHRLWLVVQRYVMGFVLGALAVRLALEPRRAA